MPRFEVVYTTEMRWSVIVEANDVDHAYQVWADSAYWDSDPDVISEDMIDVEVFKMDEEAV